MPLELTAAQLRKVADLKDEIEEHQQMIAALYGDIEYVLTRKDDGDALPEETDEEVETTSEQKDALRRGRQMSPQARAAISRAMKRRWAKAKRNGSNNL